MKLIKLLIVSTFVLSFSSVQADDVFIGPSFKWEIDGPACAVLSGSYQYWGDQRMLWSNGKKGHATFKCKMTLTVGEPQISYSEWASEGFPFPGGTCYNTISLEGEKGMWTGQCFGVWEEGF